MFILSGLGWLGMQLRKACSRGAAKRKKQQGYFAGANFESLEPRLVLTASPCNPPHPVTPPSPVSVNNHVVTIHGSVNGDSVFVQQTGNTTQIFIGSAEYDVTGVRGLIYDGSSGNATSSESVFIDVSVHTTIKLIAGAGNNFFENDSSSSTEFVGTKGNDSFVGGTGINLFELGTSVSTVTTGTCVNEVDCSQCVTSNADLSLYGDNLIFLGHGTISIFANADSDGSIVGTRSEFAALQFSADPDADCYIGIVLCGR